MPALIRTSIDTREVRAMVVDLTAAPGRMQRRAPRTMRRVAKRLERAMQRDAEGHRYLRSGFADIGSDPIDSLGLKWSVGFNKPGQPELANIIVFGSVNNAPVYRFHGPLHRQAPFIADALGADAEDCVFGGVR